MTKLLTDRLPTSIPAELAQGLAASASSTADFLVAAGRQRLGQGDSVQAARLFEAAARLDGDRHDATAGMALAFSRQGRLADAVDIIKRLPQGTWPPEEVRIPLEGTPGRFVLLFNSRTGSSWLRGILNANPRVLFAGEVLTTMIKNGRSDDHQRDWLRVAMAPPPEYDQFAVGFKTKLSIPDPAGQDPTATREILGGLDAFAAVLRETNARVIHMTRRNVVKLAVSRFNRRRLEETTGHANIRPDQGRLGKFRVPTTFIETAIAQLELRLRAVEEFNEQLGLASMEIVYEDLLVDPDAIASQVAAFLGVPHVPAPGYLQKNTPDDLRLALENYDEIAEHLAGTRYASMLSEVLIRQDKRRSSPTS